MKANPKPSHTATDNDENALLIKRRARHRLLGAIALVLTSIVVLPMVFDKNPPPLNKDLSIEIPAQDSTWQTQTKSTQNKPLANINTNTSANPTNETETATSIPPNLDDQISPRPQAINPSTESPADAAQTTEKKTEIKVSKSETQTTEHKKALAILENKTDSTNAASTKESAKPQKKSDAKMILQVGAFSTAARVEEVKKQLQKAGIHKIYTEEIATRSGQVTRIRVGPLNNQQQAETLRKKITDLGFNPTIIP